MDKQRDLEQLNTAPQPFKMFLREQGRQQLETIKSPQGQQPVVRPLVDAEQSAPTSRSGTSSMSTGGDMPRIGGMDFAPLERQQQLLSKRGEITQHFGNRNAIEQFSGGVNYGTDIAIPEGTKVALPEGDWEVVESFGGAQGAGYIGNNTNRGYGNSVLVKNRQTGEMLRFSHLSQALAQTGQVLGGGTVLGLSGSTGNATGPHLDLEFYDRQGQLANVLNSRYGGSLL